MNEDRPRYLPSKFSVIKRGGNKEPVYFDKITERIGRLSTGLNVDNTLVTIETIGAMFDMIKTSELDIIAAGVAAGFVTTHKDYLTLAGRIIVSNIHKSTPNTFSSCMIKLNRWKPNILAICTTGILDKYIKHERDYLIGYTGLQVATKQYLELINDEVCDRYQYLLMRVAIATCANICNLVELSDADIEFIVKSYNHLSMLDYTNATPSLYNSCKINMQMVSCFLYGVEDSIESIMDTVKNTAIISKGGGGIGIHQHKIRSHGRPIKSTNGKSSGLPRQLKIYNETGLTFDQGGRRKGAISIYVEPWHGDIINILKIKLNQGDESERTKDLFYGLWVPDLFVKCAKELSNWYLFSSDSAPYLSEVYDGMLVCTSCQHCHNPSYNQYITKCDVKCADTLCNYQPLDVFTKLYFEYVDRKLYTQMIPADTIMEMICISQRESGGPYVMFKDHVNRMSNQMNIGTIQSSNLCTEIVEWSDSKSYASCVLGSINLKNMYNPETNTVDWSKLHEVAEHLAEVLDNVISSNDYPVVECVHNAHNYRPIGIGIQGLANLLCLMKLPFESEEATMIDTRCMETIYHGALVKSIQLAKSRGSYLGFDNSPSSAGLLAVHLWRQNQQRIGSQLSVLEHYDWDEVAELSKTGRRNSLLLAPMPTASTASLLGNNESFDPFYSNVYVKNMKSSKFTTYNSHLVDTLTKLGIWNDVMADKLIISEGSVQNIPEIPDDVKLIYKTVTEIKQSVLMRRASLRQAFVDQSQSLNIHINDNSTAVLKGIFFTGWQLGLKTGSYYIRSSAASSAQKNITVRSSSKVDDDTNDTCQIGCTSCSS